MPGAGRRDPLSTSVARAICEAFSSVARIDGHYPLARARRSRYFRFECARRCASAAFDRLTQWAASRVGWIHLSRDIECVVLGVPTGTQDHYPAAFGGVSFISYGLGGEHRGENLERIQASSRKDWCFAIRASRAAPELIIGKL